MIDCHENAKHIEHGTVSHTYRFHIYLAAGRAAFRAGRLLCEDAQILRE